MFCVLAIHMSEKNEKKLLDSSPVSGIAVPIAIVLVGALIIWGVTQMLSTGRSYRDLVSELHSKTFGNRWVAAYELSKYIASSSIPEEDRPWVAQNLADLYHSSQTDAKTRNFTVMALGSLNSHLGVPVLIEGASDPDREVSFNAVVSLGKITGDLSQFDLKPLEAKLSSDDSGIVQVTLIALAVHNYPRIVELAKNALGYQERLVRYVAAQILIEKGEAELGNIVNEMIELEPSGQLSSAHVEGIKLNLINAIGKKMSEQGVNWLKKLKEDSNLQISTKATQLLNLLKK